MLDLLSTLGNRYWVNLDGMSINMPGGSEETVLSGDGAPAFLDSGGTLCQFTPDIFESILELFPSAFQISDGSYVVDCDLLDTDGTVDFKFGNKTISVAFADFMWNPQEGDCRLGAYEGSGKLLSFSNCDSAANQLTARTGNILGASFLRAAYVVYDRDNDNMHLAQAAECGSNLVEIGSGPDAVPSKTGECDPDQTGSAKSTSSPSSGTSGTQEPSATTTQMNSGTGSGPVTAPSTTSQTDADSADDTGAAARFGPVTAAVVGGLLVAMVSWT